MAASDVGLMAHGAAELSLPTFGKGMRYRQLVQNACAKVVDDVLDGLRAVVKSRAGRDDGGPCVMGAQHVVQVDARKGRLARDEDKWALFLEGDVCGAVDEVRSHTGGDGRKGCHGAGAYDHAMVDERAAGGACADIVLIVECMSAGGVESIGSSFMRHDPNGGTGNDHMQFDAGSGAESAA